MTNKIVLAGIAVVVLIGAFFVGRSTIIGGAAFGAIGSNPVENYIPVIKYNEGYYSDLPIQTTSTLTSAGITSSGAIAASSTLQVTGAFTAYSTSLLTSTTTMSANLVITTTNAATSSVQVGCVQTYATSTATPIKQMFYASSTLAIDTTVVTTDYGGGTMQGLVLWGFGKCPRI